MRVAVSAESNLGLEANVSSHFGHSPHFALVDLDGKEIKSVLTVANPAYPDHVPGAIPKFIHGQGVDVVLTGGMGHRAVSIFEKYGIRPVTGASGTVRQAVEKFLRGELIGSTPCHEHESDSHAGCVQKTQ